MLLPANSLCNNHFDDIFGSSPEASPTLHAFESVPTPQAQVSDIPALRRAHVTSGYRDGIAASKSQCVQEGFDEGFALGAVIGSKVGWILGVLEGLVIALNSACHEKPPIPGNPTVGAEDGVSRAALDADNPQEIHTRFREAAVLLKDARRELQTTSIFSQQYFAEDGIWQFELPLQPDQSTDDITFPEVAAAHPLVKRWSDTVESLARDWKINLSVFD
ncbi:Essential protein Yae1, N terminal [Coniosporium tulheliwenetii]|uniref:Essential protein Yae1, N terminal n=1 Tax=Coniosporium tulheliwenetii TaxID=3383036 RepID=A0ACC2Z289_9PEZI|nr:Essential protein Yae1, N terminal [Cladosporium sp. JES 115]